MFMIRDRFMSYLSRYKWQWLKSSGDGAFSANPDGAGGMDDVLIEKRCQELMDWNARLGGYLECREFDCWVSLQAWIDFVDLLFSFVEEACGCRRLCLDLDGSGVVRTSDCTLTQFLLTTISKNRLYQRLTNISHIFHTIFWTLMIHCGKLTTSSCRVGRSWALATAAWRSSWRPCARRSSAWPRRWEPRSHCPFGGTPSKTGFFHRFLWRCFRLWPFMFKNFDLDLKDLKWGPAHWVLWESLGIQKRQQCFQGGNERRCHN